MTGKVDRFSDNHHMIDWIWKRQMGRYPQDLIVKPRERGVGGGLYSLCKNQTGKLG